MIKVWRKRLHVRMSQSIFLAAQRVFVTQDVAKTSIASKCAFVLSMLVLITPFLVFGAGVFLVTLNFPSVIFMIIGGIVMAIGGFLIPRRPKPTGKGFSASEIPHFFAFLDEVADQIGCQGVEYVHFSTQFNASMTNFGRKGGWRLEIGLPLWAVLTDPEKLALIAHELAHQKNGDPTRGIIVNDAFVTLAQWRFFLTYQDSPSDFGDPSWAELCVRVFFAIGRGVISFVEFILLRLCFYDQQRAEYLADAIQGQIAGKQAAIACLEKTAFRPLLKTALLRANPKGERRGQKLLQKLGNAIKEADPDRRERLLEEMRTEDVSVDRSHPPTNLRIAFLETLDLPDQPPHPETLALMQQEHELSDVKEDAGLLILQDRNLQ